MFCIKKGNKKKKKKEMGNYVSPIFMYQVEAPMYWAIGMALGLLAYNGKVLFWTVNMTMILSLIIMSRNWADDNFNWWGHMDADNSKEMIPCNSTMARFTNPECQQILSGKRINYRERGQGRSRYLVGR